MFNWIKKLFFHSKLDPEITFLKPPKLSYYINELNELREAYLYGEWDTPDHWADYYRYIHMGSPPKQKQAL